MMCPCCAARDRYVTNQAFRGVIPNFGLRSHRCARCDYVWYSTYDPAASIPAKKKFPFLDHRTRAEIQAAEKAA